MKVWPIDPLVPRNLRLEVPEKLPQGWAGIYCHKYPNQSSGSSSQALVILGERVSNPGDMEEIRN
jgi:hypothetical protein